MAAKSDLVGSTVSITPSDSDTFPPTVGLYVGTAGDVKVTTANGQDVTFKNLSAGLCHPIKCRKVFSTGTTAVNILGLY